MKKLTIIAILTCIIGCTTDKPDPKALIKEFLITGEWYLKKIDYDSTYMKDGLKSIIYNTTRGGMQIYFQDGGLTTIIDYHKNESSQFSWAIDNTNKKIIIKDCGFLLKTWPIIILDNRTLCINDTIGGVSRYLQFKHLFSWEDKPL
jgi:hypothetical protein